MPRLASTRLLPLPLALLVALCVLLLLPPPSPTAADGGPSVDEIEAACEGESPYYVVATHCTPRLGRVYDYDPSIVLTDDTARDEPHYRVASIEEVGTVWGLAFARGEQVLYAGAFHKRQMPFGPGGPGAIYRIDLDSGDVALWAQVPDAGEDHHRLGRYSLDVDAAEPAGRTSLGDLELSEDETMLFVVNLADRRIYRYHVADGALLGAFDHGAADEPWAEDARPFGLGMHEGWLYHGVVNTAESTQREGELLAQVYRSRLELVRDGRRLAVAEADQRWGGSVALGLFDPGTGAPIDAVPGDVLRGRLDGRGLELALPTLEASLALSGSRMVGRAPPGAVVRLAVDGAATGRRATADAKGRYTLTLAEGGAEAAPPGTEMAAFLRVDGGHTVQRRLRSPSLELAAGARRHTLRATAHTALTLTHQPVDASPATRQRIHVSGTGVADFTLAAPLQAGDVITVEVGTGGTVAVVPETSAAFDPERLRLEGSAPPYRGMVAEIDVAAEALPLRYGVVVGPSGRWRSDLALPPGRDALLGSAARAVGDIRVRLRLPDAWPGAIPGAPHELVLRPEMDGRDGPREVYLPWGCAHALR